MIAFYLLNTLLVVVGGIFFMIGGVASWVSLGEYQSSKDWFGLCVGTFLMVVAIGLFYIAGSWYPSDFIISLVGG